VGWGVWGGESSSERAKLLGKKKKNLERKMSQQTGGEKDNGN